MTGKTVIITGANTGIGKQTALDLANRGATIVFACRNNDTVDIIDEIQRKTKNNKLVYMHLDLSDNNSIYNFAQKVIYRYNNIDILINNAGQLNTGFKIEKQGYESNFAINHLGHFLLTNLLLEKLQSTPQSRVVILSSEAHKNVKNIDYSVLSVNDQQNQKDKYAFIYIFLKNLFIKTKNQQRKFYDQSKFANLLFSNELSKRIDGQNMKVVAVHPGLVRNNMFNRFIENNYGWFIKPFIYLSSPLIWLVTKSNYYGAQTTLTCCYMDFDKLQNGGYYRDNKLSQCSKAAQDQGKALELWEFSEYAVGLKQLLATL